MIMVPDWAAKALELLASLFVLVVGLGALAVVVMFIIDITQTKDAVRRNYPVLGRFRYLFTTLGEFFRQYFFAMDREEMPFNRAEREWVYRAAQGEDDTIAFGSTKRLTPPGTYHVTPYAYAVKPGDDAWWSRVERFMVDIKRDGRLQAAPAP